ncbi:hypothetical protein KIW84_010157 [Lathyrus oleraceus]|uniref:Gag/pol protein n=1 Tax=Pisum sativum TaxID=3888 RepID=A0A9D4YK36_PEA|nr:hypothetical protein KIW84_010157 [Pisum sativum]
MNKIPYAYAIGSIMYAMLCTRPDVLYALSATSRYQYDPGDAHWIVVKNILKYLRRTKNSFLIYEGQEELAQDTVVDSNTEAEYIDASSAVKEVVWIKKFISELGIVPSIVDPIGLYCDNNGAIAQAKEVPTLDNIADPLTKPLAQQKHDGHTRSMGIRGMSDWL